jgi:hypothetical protein
MAMIAVTLVVASGIANAGFRVAGSFGKLFDSAYGAVLLKKLAVVAAMLAVAYFNRFIATPRVRAASSKGMRQIIWRPTRRACPWRFGFGDHSHPCWPERLGPPDPILSMALWRLAVDVAGRYLPGLAF